MPSTKTATILMNHDKQIVLQPMINKRAEPNGDVSPNMLCIIHSCDHNQMSHRTPQNKRGPCHTRNKDPNIQHRTKTNRFDQESLYTEITCTGNQIGLVPIVLTSQVTSKNIVVQMSLLFTDSVAKQEQMGPIEDKNYLLYHHPKEILDMRFCHTYCLHKLCYKKLAKHEQSILVANQTPHVPYTPTKYQGSWSTLLGEKRKNF